MQRGSYKLLRVARRLREMLDDSLLAERAGIVAQQLSREDGVRTACDALEELYRRTR
jgi:UDP:flavonoid glycosyltransferase YjiC (YdhE family)